MHSRDVRHMSTDRMADMQDPQIHTTVIGHESGVTVDVQPQTRGPFIRIPRRAAEPPLLGQLSASACRVYWAICSRLPGQSEYVEVTIRALSEQSGLHRGTVRRARDELASVGLIRVMDGGERPDEHTYRVLFDEKTAASPHPQDPQDVVHARGSSFDPGCARAPLECAGAPEVVRTRTPEVRRRTSEVRQRTPEVRRRAPYRNKNKTKKKTEPPPPPPSDVCDHGQAESVGACGGGGGGRDPGGGDPAPGAGPEPGVSTASRPLAAAAGDPPVTDAAPPPDELARAAELLRRRGVADPETWARRAGSLRTVVWLLDVTATAQDQAAAIVARIQRGEQPPRETKERNMSDAPARPNETFGALTAEQKRQRILRQQAEQERAADTLAAAELQALRDWYGLLEGEQVQEILAAIDRHQPKPIALRVRDVVRSARLRGSNDLPLRTLRLLQRASEGLAEQEARATGKGGAP